MLGDHVVLHAGPRVVLKKELEWCCHQQRMEGLLAIQSMLHKPETAVITDVQVCNAFYKINTGAHAYSGIFCTRETVTVSDLSL